MKIYQKRIYREDLKANPNCVYLFGDNLLRVGMGGQAGEMRGEPNAVGIPTKKAPGMADADFFTDEEFEANCEFIDDELFEARRLSVILTEETGLTDTVIIIPLDGLGTGLAELDKRAPRTFEYLQDKLANL